MVKRNLFTKGKVFLASAVLAFAFVVASTATVVQSQTAGAQSSQGECDDVNIIRCGLNGGSVAEYVSSLKSFYTRGTDGFNNDLKHVFQWAGATDSMINGMNTTNTKMGTLYRNGEIKVGDKLVGRDSWVSARFTQGEGFVHIGGDVYARKTTTSFAQDSAPVIVHFDANGKADFAVMTGCGNAVKFTPIPPSPPPPPPPAPIVSCDVLTQVKAPGARTYKYTVKATAKNTKIVSYEFHFSDGKVKTVETSDTSASTTYTFAEDGETYNTVAYVNTTDKKDVTSDKCRATVTTPYLVCDLLTAQQVKGQPLTYNFTAKAKAKEVKIVSYTFHFGDGKDKTVTTDNTTAGTVHTYTENDKTYTAYVIVTSTDGKTEKTNRCTVTIKTPKVEECKPNVPIGSPECEEEPPVITPPVTPPELPAAGVGSIVSIFGATSVLGALLHRFVLRRRFQS